MLLLFFFTNRYQSKVPSECSHGDGTPLIVYKNLVSDIEAVFTVEGLEKKATTTNVEQVCMMHLNASNVYVNLEHSTVRHSSLASCARFFGR